MHRTGESSGITVLLAASLVAAVLGSVHAFSVFLSTLEQQFTASRSAVSLTYSLALVALTIAVLLGPRIFTRAPAWVFLMSACLLAAGGAILAGFAGSLWLVWVGYSLIFGTANGLGYGFGLQIAAQVNPGREGLAMGTVTASYAFGAVVSPALFESAVALGGFRLAMIDLAIVLVGIGIVAGALLRSGGCRFQSSAKTQGGNAARGSERLLWAGYFGGALSGLMVIGHAAGIAQASHPQMATWAAPVTIAACNLAGSLLGGRLADRIQLGILLAALALVTGAALIGLAVFGGPRSFLMLLGVIGFAYGGTISAYPAAIAKLFGMQQSARVYGRVFTAWGTAGLVGPWLAGYLFDMSGNYTIALLFAAATAGVSVLAVATLFLRKTPIAG